MELPRVKIYYENGALGQVIPMDDGCLGLCCTGAPVVNKFELVKAYVLRSYNGLSDLGITAENNPCIEKVVREFYAEAGDGTEVWLMGFPETLTPDVVCDVNQNNAKSLIVAANGKLRSIIVAFAPAATYTPIIENGLDETLAQAIVNAQALCEWATTQRNAPIFALLEARSFSGDAMGLSDLTEQTNNRVAVVIGDTVNDSADACVGVIAGRIAIMPVQRNIGRVKDGALKPLQFYIGDAKADSYGNIQLLFEKGYITFRTFTGKAGFFIVDANTATKVGDDYRSLANRRVIDKAYRIAYQTLIEELNDEVPVTDNGQLVPAWCANIESKVEQAIISQMTNNGNLGNDVTNPKDTGVTCTIDHNQNIVATEHLSIQLRVKPNGYAKYIDVYLGFKTLT